MSQISVIDGLGDNLGLKAPVRCAIRSLPSGEASGLGPVTPVGGSPITLADGERVLYAPASANAQAGIYDVSSGLWVRSADFDGARDAIEGTRVFTWGGQLWALETEAPFTIGTTALLFSQDTFANVSTGDIAIIANVAGLRAATDATLTASTLILVGYYSSAVTSGPDDGGGIFHRDDDDGSTADDGGCCLIDASGRRWKRAFSGPINVKWFGAKGDGTTDDLASLDDAAATASTTGKGLYAPVGIYRVSGSFVCPTNVALEGCGLILPSSEGTTVGTVFLGDNAVTPVVQLSSPPSSIIDATSVARGFVVARTGAPASGAIGLKVEGGQGVQLENIFSYGHANNFYLDGNPGTGTGDGIAAFLTRIFSGRASENHLVIDTWPEVRMEQSRLGVNGVGDVDCNAYVLITGGITAAPAAGPNTVVFNNSQFNQGQNAPDYWVSLENLPATLPDISFTPAASDCHVEGVGVAVLHGDATLTNVSRLGLSNNSFNCPSADFFDLVRATTAINESRLANNFIVCATFAPDVDTVNGLVLAGNDFSACDVTYASGSVGNWVMSSMGNTYQAASTCTLSGSRFSNAIFADTISVDSTFTNSISDNHEAVTVLNPKNATIAWTPTLKFGGNSVGLTYSATNTVGSMQIVGNAVTLEGRIILTAKGSSTGAATIRGFPVPQSTGLYATGPGGICFCDSGMTGLTGPVFVKGPVAAAPGYLELIQQAAAGTAPIDDTVFTNTSDIAFSVTYFL